MYYTPTHKWIIVILSTLVTILGTILAYQARIRGLPTVQAQCTVDDVSGCEHLISLNSQRWREALTVQIQANKENNIYRAILSLHQTGAVATGDATSKK